MSEAPQLLNLSEAAQLAFPRTPAAMAVIAYASPVPLERSIQQAEDDGTALGLLKNRADQVYEIAKRRSNESPASVNLPTAAQIALDAETLRTGHKSSVELAREVSELRRKLSRSARITNTVVRSLEYVVAGELLEYVIYSHSGLATEYTIQGIIFGSMGAMSGFTGGKRRLGATAKKKASAIATRMNTVEELPVYFPPGQETEENKVGMVKVTGSEAGKLIEATFLDKTFKSPKTVRKGVFLDRRAHRAARRTVQAMAYRAEAQLGYSPPAEQHDSLLI